MDFSEFPLLTKILIAAVIIAFSVFIQFVIVRGVAKKTFSFFDKIFGKPRCSLCNNELQDYGCAVGGVAPEPCYICVNEKCERCEL